ncbi:MAG: FAD-dependent oxidoreductase [Saprospiraceae bacterium]|nr:FAD-dependent oxidoreductase [Saprospiraceae bacterium]
MPIADTRIPFTDYLIIGGGLFGCYAALYLAAKGASVILLEKEERLFRKASLVNQARLHGGYHYPRSVATAAMSDEHKTRFTDEHRDMVNFAFEKYYAIDRYGSFTDARQFERFCQYLGIRCEAVRAHPLFNYERLEALYLTEEYSFDPVLLARHYTGRIEAQPNITLHTRTIPVRAEATNLGWQIQTTAGAFRTPTVINATYAGMNAVNRLFGVPDLELTHEISEIAFITSRAFDQKGLTVMDGPFGSIMPYGLSGLLSLSSVAYTHHNISYQNLPNFACMSEQPPACLPQAPGICTTCPRRPEPNAPKMLAQMRRYFSEQVDFQYLFSYFTIKSKLKASYIDDGRPTEITKMREEPAFYCLFSGKVNSIYEIEKMM